MSYRKIEVNGVTYEYVIGKVCVKIKGFGVFKIEDYADPIGFPSLQKDGTYAFQQTLRPGNGKHYAWHLTPRHIRGIITGKKAPPMQLMVDPYDSEIKGIITYMAYNADRYFDRRDDI